MIEVFLSFLVILNVFVVYLFYELIKRKVLFFLALATGIFLSNIFLHLLPKISEEFYFLILLSYLSFFLIEYFFHFHHHGESDHFHQVGLLNLLADSLHNFLDGLAIASAFNISNELGFLVFLSVILHELPQELGDFSILVYSGFNKKKALFLNFLVSLSTPLGTLVGLFFNFDLEIIIPIIVGSFLYIASSDLVPLLKRERDWRILFFLFLGLLVPLIFH